MTTLYEKLKTYLVEEFDVSPEEITPGATLEQLEVDSLALAEMSVIVEDETGQQLDDIDPSCTLEQLVRRLSEEASTAASATTC